jgi:hypothetical protein
MTSSPTREAVEAMARGMAETNNTPVNNAHRRDARAAFNALHAGGVDTLTRLRSELAESIRSYVRGQVDIWREVPDLMRRANGRGGWSDTYTFCSEYHKIRLSSSVMGGTYTTAVNCDTGEIEYLSGGLSSDPDVVRLDYRELDASQLRRRLKGEIAR